MYERNDCNNFVAEYVLIRFTKDKSAPAFCDILPGQLMRMRNFSVKGSAPCQTRELNVGITGFLSVRQLMYVHIYKKIDCNVPDKFL